MLKTITDIDKHRELLGILVGRNLKIRYKRSVLGFLWTLLNPLLFIIIYATFLKLLKCYEADNPFFLPGLVTGVVIWQFLAMCLGDSLYAVLGNANLVSKTSFPRIVLPLASVTADLVNLLLSLAILLVYMLILRATGLVPIHFHYIGLLPVVVLTQTALCLGLSLIISCMNVFFRDTEHLLGVVMLAWFFLTPIIYTFERIPEQYQRLAFLNPMTGVVVAYRTAMMGTSIMAPRLMLISFAMAWAILLIGIVFFQRVQGRLVEEF
jgi:ABC-2 type transport system permease protein